MGLSSKSPFANLVMYAKSGPYYEAVERAKRWYHDRIKHELGDDLDGQWIVIDSSNGNYEADADFMRAWLAMKHRVSEADRVFVHDGEFLPGHLAGFARALWTSMPPRISRLGAARRIA